MLFNQISAFFVGGGVWMIPIAIAQLVSLAIIIERAISLYVAYSANQKQLARHFEEEIKRGQLEKVLLKAQSMGYQPLASVVIAGTQAAIAMGGREEIQSKMDEVLLHQNAKFERRTGFLAMLGNVGTLLGLLGTIIGMTEAFGSVATANAAEKGAVLAKGISMAMNATAYGLIMAIPALVMYAILQNRANQLTEDLNQAALKVYNWLSYSYEAIPHKSARSK